MKNLLLIIIPILLWGCSSSDDHFDFDILCSATWKSDYTKGGLDCAFYFFPAGEYVKIIPVTGDIRDGVYGKATAQKKDGSIVENIGYAYYSEKRETLVSAVYLKNQKPIREGSFYVACMPYSDNPHIFKGKIITKTLDKGIAISPFFSHKALSGSRIGYFEWDE